jgi:hypothetical protein
VGAGRRAAGEMKKFCKVNIAADGKAKYGAFTGVPPVEEWTCRCAPLTLQRTATKQLRIRRIRVLAREKPAFENDRQRPGRVPTCACSSRHGSWVCLPAYSALFDGRFRVFRWENHDPFRQTRPLPPTRL